MKHSLLLIATLALPLTLHAQLPAGTRPADSATQATPLSQAEDAIAAQHYDEAKKLLLEIDPKDARVNYDLGYVDEALHDKTAAEADYRTAIAADPKNFEAHAALGFLLQTHDPAEAHKELSAAAALSPATNVNVAKARVLRALAQIDLAAAPTNASNELLAAIQITPETQDDLYLIGEIAESMGELAGAQNSYQRVINDPDSDAALADAARYSLANILIHQDKLTDAEALLTAGLKAHPDNAPLSAQLARVYMLQGADDKAVPLLEEEHKHRPQDAAVTHMLADVYDRTGDAPHADALYQQLLAAAPDDIGLLAARGDSLIQQKKFAEAQAVLQKASAIFLARPAALPSTDDRVQLYGSLAFAASENGQPAAVLTALDQRVQYAPEIPSTLFLRATAHDHLHHVVLARNFYTQFIAAAGDKYPDETWEAKHRLIALKTEK